MSDPITQWAAELQAEKLNESVEGWLGTLRPQVAESLRFLLKCAKHSKQQATAIENHFSGLRSRVDAVEKAFEHLFGVNARKIVETGVQPYAEVLAEVKRLQKAIDAFTPPTTTTPPPDVTPTSTSTPSPTTAVAAPPESDAPAQDSSETRSILAAFPSAPRPQPTPPEPDDGIPIAEADKLRFRMLRALRNGGESKLREEKQAIADEYHLAPRAVAALFAHCQQSYAPKFVRRVRARNPGEEDWRRIRDQLADLYGVDIFKINQWLTEQHNGEDGHAQRASADALH